MPNHEVASYCLVRWEDDAIQYAVVDTKRLKSVSALKIGLTTCFEGFQRERRRGTILFLGSKKDCCVYGLDIAGDDGHVNMYQWSLPPGLREESEEIVQSIRHTTNSFKRTISNMSSSSSNSTVTGVKHKKKKVNNNNPHDNALTTTDKAMPPPPLASTITICDSLDTPNKCVNQGQKSNTNDNNSSSSLTNANCSIAPSTDVNSLVEEINDLRKQLLAMASVQQENKVLREKLLSTEDELFYLRNTCIKLPDEAAYKYIRSLLDAYEQSKAESTQKAIELAEKLPCSKMELKTAKNPNLSRTINNLIKCCYKGIDLKSQNYTKLKSINSELMENIFEYVQYIHAPKVITAGEFSGAISLRCRHLADQDKNKENSSISSTKKEQKKHLQNKHTEREQYNNSSREILMENFDCEGQ